MQRIATKDFAMRAIRVVLVFALVFWSSFSVQSLAFAQILADNAGGRADGSLQNMEVWQVSDLDKDDKSVLVKRIQNAKDAAEGKQAEVTDLKVGTNGKLQFVALPVWAEGSEKKFTITYVDGNDPDNVLNKYEDVAYGVDTPIPEDPTWDGHTFAGWDPDPKDTKVEGDATYLARWEADTFTITYTDGSGNVLETYTVPYGEAVPVPDDPTWEGHTFAGWSPSPSGTVTEDATFEAQWTENSYSVTYNDDDGSVLYSYTATHGQDVPVPDNPTRDGYTFTGWNPAPSGSVTGDLSFTATWSKDPEPEPEPSSEAVQTESVVQDTSTRPSPAVANVVTRPEPATVAKDENDLVIANFVKWESDNPSVAEVQVEGGVATVVGVSPGKATITCYPDTENGFDSNLIDPEFTGTFAVSFDVQVVYVSSLEIYRVDTNVRVDGSADEPLTLSDEERESFAFKTLVHVATGNAQDGTQDFECDSAEHTLSKLSDGMLEDLTWGVYDAEGQPADPAVASITADGVLTLAADSAVIVRCTSPNGENGDYFENVYVQTGNVKKKESYQGEDHHQDTLTVKVQRPKAKLETSNGESGQDEQTAEGEETVDSEESSENAESAEGEEEAQSSDEATDAQSGYEETTASYSKDLANNETGAQLDVNEKDYAMTLDGRNVTVSGRGTTLGLLLNDAGVTLEDQKSIESLEFVNVFEKHTTVPWSDLVNTSHAEATYIMVAKQAYVHEPASADEEESTTGEDGQSAEDTEGTEDGQAEGTDETPAENQGESEEDDAEPSDPFLDNTRFQILFDQAEGISINVDDLRWVNTIIVHMKGIKEPTYVENLRPTIDYSPVPKGATALLTAVPPTSIGSANFGYRWERSTDEGQTWTEVANNTQQTIHVPTDDDHIGNLYRVSVIVDDGDSEPSDPVTIQEGTGFVVQLDYVPPIAGSWADFTSRIIGADESDPNIKYRWEQSTDGGKTWTEIPNETGKTLHVKTNPISESSASDDDDAEPVLTYIHVIAVLNSQSSTSNRQLLTVRVGEEGGTDSEQTDGNQTKSDESANPNDDKKPESSKPEGSKPELPANVKPTELTFDDPDDDYDDDDDYNDEDDGENEGDEGEDSEQAADKTPAGNVSPVPTDASSIIVDEEVSKKIKEQVKETKKKQSEGTPGARWTEISAVNPTTDEVRRVLAGNPFAPLAAPFALGLTAAGVVEKLAAFRRQIR